jgi:hypothetical protein
MSTTANSPIIKGQAAQKDCLTLKDIENRKTGERVFDTQFVFNCLQLFQKLFFSAQLI